MTQPTCCILLSNHSYGHRYTSNIDNSDVLFNLSSTSLSHQAAQILILQVTMAMFHVKLDHAIYFHRSI